MSNKYIIHLLAKFILQNFYADLKNIGGKNNVTLKIKNHIKISVFMNIKFDLLYIYWIRFL